MGRRSINTTKSGKYMNPTDQARKEARKKELKKNKKQRQLVRAAVLKGKDPSQIIEEMEKIDQMEYNVLQPPPLNEKVLKDKRKKLKETLDRVLKMYGKDDQDKWLELKEQLIQYERRRIELVSYYEAVKHAQQVQVDEIPLPSSGNDGNRAFPGGMTAQIPLPEMPQPAVHPYPPHYLPQHQPLVNIPVPPSILKKTNLYSATGASGNMPMDRDPPGVPPFPPPDVFASDDEDGDGKTKTPVKTKTIRFVDDEKAETYVQDSEKDKDSSQVKPTSLQQKMLAMAGMEDIDHFMKEMEVVHKKRETERAQDLNTRLTLLESNKEKEDEPMPMPSNNVPTQPPMPLMGLPPPPPLMYRPPPPPLHLRIPPPPPPRMGIRLPPGPPPGMPRLMRPGGPMSMGPRVMGPGMGMHGMPPPPPAPPSGLSNAQKQSNVLSAAPQLISKGDKEAGGKSATTIEAKPQIRNLAADVTRFLPTSLRVKRADEKKKPSSAFASSVRAADRMNMESPMVTRVPQQVKTKEDDYLQFMREMQGLL
ncbi:WW domain-binding protein 11 [Trichogramma pretiosum]|uniref:WW domain-binding protein 11 n=1 Tax=Trichogramma pretiosum TaxID=7493 RepID=UPI0006C970EA|nr:WW domain-binding protein 11 [Trichogramma pretiosum]